jgi:hypothetical protein
MGLELIAANLMQNVAGGGRRGPGIKVDVHPET